MPHPGVPWAISFPTYVPLSVLKNLLALFSMTRMLIFHPSRASTTSYNKTTDRLSTPCPGCPAGHRDRDSAAGRSSLRLQTSTACSHRSLSHTLPETSGHLTRHPLCCIHIHQHTQLQLTTDSSSPQSCPANLLCRRSLTLPTASPTQFSGLLPAMARQTSSPQATQKIDGQPTGNRQIAYNSTVNTHENPPMANIGSHNNATAPRCKKR